MEVDWFYPKSEPCVFFNLEYLDSNHPRTKTTHAQSNHNYDPHNHHVHKDPLIDHNSGPRANNHHHSDTISNPLFKTSPFVFPNLLSYYRFP